MACPPTTWTWPATGHCPTTTLTQTLEWQSIGARVLPPHVQEHKQGTQPTTTWTQPFVLYKECHINYPLFTTYPGGMPVIPVKYIQPFKCCQTHITPILLQDCRFINIVKCEIYTKVNLIRSMQTTQIMYDFVTLRMHNKNITQSRIIFSAKCWIYLKTVWFNLLILSPRPWVQVGWLIWGIKWSWWRWGWWNNIRFCAVQQC